MIRLAEILLEPQPTPFWRMLRQVGVDEAVGVLPRALRDWRGEEGDHPWELAPLTMYQAGVEAEGFKLAVIEDNPPMDRIRLGRPGRDEELEQVAVLVRNMGRLGIPVLCYNWAAVLGWIRTEMAARGRGGAIVAGYNHARMRDVPPPRTGTADEEDALGEPALVPRAHRPRGRGGEGAARDAPRRPAALAHPRRWRGSCAASKTSSGWSTSSRARSNGITLCQGNFTLMTDDLPAAIRQFGEQGKIFFVHFRDVRGTPEKFVETFHDEGQTDMLACMRAYRDIGFDGVLRPDHDPTLEGDSASVPGYSALGRLHAIGYMQGLREAVYATPAAA